MSLLFWGRSFSWVSAVLFEFASLLSGIDLPVGCLIFCLGVSLPVGRTFSSCLVCDLLFGGLPSCWEGIFLMRLLSVAFLPVGFAICCLGVSLSVGKTFS